MGVFGIFVSILIPFIIRKKIIDKTQVKENDEVAQQNDDEKEKENEIQSPPLPWYKKIV